jgi:hypothetical protein
MRVTRLKDIAVDVTPSFGFLEPPLLAQFAFPTERR